MKSNWKIYYRPYFFNKRLNVQKLWKTSVKGKTVFFKNKRPHNLETLK